MNRVIKYICVLLCFVGLALIGDITIWHWNNDHITNIQVLKMFWPQTVLGTLSWCGGIMLNFHRLVHYS